MSTLLKYELTQEVFYLKGNKVHSAPVLQRSYVDGKSPFEDHFFDEGAWYETCHGIFGEFEVFATKIELLESL